MAKKRKPIPEERKQTLQNVRIGGKRATKDESGRFTTDKSRQVTQKDVAPTQLEPIKLEAPEKKKVTFRDIASIQGRAFAGSTAEVIPTTGKRALKLAGRVAGGILTAGTGAAALTGFKTAQKAASFVNNPTATVSFSVSAHRLIKTGAGAEKLIGLGTRTATRSFIGKPGTTGVNKIFNLGSRAVATRFATNTKSLGLTNKILIGAGLSLGAVSIARDIIGTYPFAAFGKEEGLQVIGFPISRLIDAGELEKAQELLNMSNEIIELVPSKIPYKNVLQEFRKYVDAQSKANEGWQTLIDNRKAEESPEDKWARIYTEQRERDDERRKETEEYFEMINQKRIEATEQERLEAAAYYENIYQENKKRDEEDRRKEDERWAAINANLDDWNAGGSQLDFGLF